MTTFTTKLGTNKKVERSRIWIEGQRLTDALFTRGVEYQRWFNNGALYLVPTNGKPDEYLGRVYKVAGKGDHPIIDITGAVVTEHFGERATVRVTFRQNTIIIEKGAAE